MTNTSRQTFLFQKLTYLFIALVLFTACSGSLIKYETYHNQFYNYTVEYPDFLIPQGEATNQDGQRFVSQDQKIQLFVYRDYKNDYLTGGDLYTINEAYQEDLKSKQGVLNKEIKGKQYIIEYKINDTLHTDYALLYGNEYFNIRFEYPEKDQEMMKGAIKHVVSSFKVGTLNTSVDKPKDNASAGGLEETFPAFLGAFLNDGYWGKNFNSLLRNKDQSLAIYIDPKMDVQRYYAPGTVSKLASRAEDFGFTQENDFTSKPKTDGDNLFEIIVNNANPCELDFHKKNTVYYQWIQKVPDVVVNTETFETKPIRIEYPDAMIMSVYVPNTYGNPRGFYFINTPDGWKLAFVDDTLCGGPGS